MKRIIVVGSPGAGKSTFARRMGELTGLPVHHLDLLWHRPDRSNVTQAEFDAALEGVLQGEGWIIDGNYSRTLERRMEACDTVFFLDYPLDVCLAGARDRIGKKREDFPYLETELDPEFYQWILDFPKDHLPRLYRLVERYRGSREVVVFRSREEAEAYLVAWGQGG